MKYLLSILVLVLCLPTPAAAQIGCPPVSSPTATNVIYSNDYQAWLDFRPYWQQCGAGAFIFGTDLGEAIVSIQFDPYLRYNLYAYGVNGGVYQINVATNQMIMLVNPIPPIVDSPGEASGQPVEVNPTPETMTPLPETLEARVKFGGWGWWFRVIRLAGLWQ